MLIRIISQIEFLFLYKQKMIRMEWIVGKNVLYKNKKKNEITTIGTGSSQEMQSRFLSLYIRCLFDSFFALRFVYFINFLLCYKTIYLYEDVGKFIKFYFFMNIVKCRNLVNEIYFCPTMVIFRVIFNQILR